MKTTSLLVEIVLVGGMFFLCLVPLLSLVLSLEPLSIISTLLKAPVLVQIGGIYIGGILWNRVCDEAFRFFDNLIIKTKFESKGAYQKARIKCVLTSDTVDNYLSVRRSSLRILRASSVMFLIYTITTPIYLFGNQDLPLSLGSKVGICSLMFSMLLLSVYAWVRLEKGYVNAIFCAMQALDEGNRDG